MLDRANTQPSGSAPSATGYRVGTRQLRELLAARGEAGLWLADDHDGSETLLRLYPGLPTLAEWHKLAMTARHLLDVVDPRLVPIEEIALDVWPCLTFACADAEPLSRRLAREPMAPEAAIAMCADVAGALATLAGAGLPPVDVSPADIVLVGERARLLSDVGLANRAHACVDLDYVAPERAAAIEDSRQGTALVPDAGYPTAASMTYALAAIVTSAINGPQPLGIDPDDTAAGEGPASMPLPAGIEQTLRRGLAHSPSERYEAPAALAAALGDAIGVDLRDAVASAPRAVRTRDTRAATVARQGTRPRRRRTGVAIAGAAVLAAAVIGTVAGSATTPPGPPAVVTLAGAGFRIEAPRGWLRAAAGEVSSAIGAPALVARPPGRASATALAVTRAAGPLLAELTDDVPEAVRLGRQDAWRYRNVAVDAQSVADVYVIEDGGGPIVAACLGPAEAPPSVRARCSAALTTLRLPAGRAAALGGDVAARRGLARVVEQLDQTRGSERRALAAATTGRRQAAAADRLAAAYARAADGARKTGTVGAPGDLPRLVDRLQQTGRAYAALASAARGTRRTAYAQARDGIAVHERALGEDLAALAASSAGS